MLGWFNIAKRLQVAEDMLLKLDRKMDELELDYADMRARCKRLLDRTEKAAQRLENPVASEEPIPGAGGEPVEGAPSGRLLTSRQMTIQQQILQRRRHFNGGGQ